MSRFEAMRISFDGSKSAYLSQLLLEDSPSPELTSEISAMKKTGNPSVSVVMPCYNAEKWVGTAIDSVLRQNYAPLELILINDGSSDRTSEIISTYKKFAIIVNQKNKGVSAARNIGAKLASGDYVRFLDADDIMPSGAISSVIDVANLFPNSVIVGRSNIIDANGEWVSDRGYNIGYYPAHGEAIRGEYLLTQATQSSLWMFPRAVLVDGLRFDEEQKLGEEYGFSRRLLQLSVACIYADVLVCSVRQHYDDRLSRRGREADYISQLDEIKNNLEFIRSRIGGADHAAMQLIAERCWSLGRHCARLGFVDAAQLHFSVASSLCGRKAINGRIPYKIMLAALGPIRAERCLMMMKSLFARTVCTQ